MSRLGGEAPRTERAIGPPPRARKSLGQHFLVDRRVTARIVKAADPDGAVIVEVGPGRGVLTAALAGRAARLIAVELDPALADRMAVRFAAEPSVTVVAADAREVDPAALTDGAPYRLVANLPYYAAMPIVRRFMESAHPPDRMVVMVQREVAEVIIAKPGGMTMLSVAVQVYGSPAIVCRVSPRAFRPPPKVSSAVVRIDLYDRPVVPTDDLDGFFRVAKAGFRAPRKTVRNSLRHGLGVDQDAVDRALDAAGIPPSLRPGALSLDDWGRCYRAFRDHGPEHGSAP